MFYSFLLEEAATGSSAYNWIWIVMLVVIVAFFYFFMIRPQKKQEKQANEMRNALQVGDEITTIGGIIGEIVSIKEETITIETSRDRTKIRFLRSAVRSVDVRAEDKNPALKKAAAAAPAAPAAQDAKAKKKKGKIAPETPKTDDKKAEPEVVEPTENN